MLPVQLPVHRQDSRSRETILSPFQALQAAQQAAASPHGQFGNQLGNPLGAEAVAQQRAVHHEHPSAAYSGFIPPDLQPSVVLDKWVPGLPLWTY